ncbi:hypothetical protein FNB15_12335 [Ferrovibrio terrae]|uniref:Uncharacterized protein n=1 Tax=Ferrovibrio terrae TaxID=2594003 RepID=A0A516H2M1_9PROT|nr:DUF4286 family protein [Ferrovibrio terrae]QDO98009.1 hypothetical protein FNB15_12335 [Ferrovibrio terrae]
MQGNGFLAIWSDVSSAQETDYLHWLTREHTEERLGVQGFIAVRVFKALLDGVHRFLIVYELESEAALAGQPYLDRLNAPTPWSQRIMPILGNFARGGGRRIASAGSGRGGIVAALRLAAQDLPGEDLLHALVAGDRIVAAHLLRTDQARTGIKTGEKGLRANDGSFDGLLLVEGLDQAAVRAALTAAGLDRHAPPQLYAQVFALG